MKKIILAALMLTVTAALAGCGATPGEQPAAPTTQIPQTPQTPQATAAYKQVTVDVTRDFWGVSAVKVAAATTGDLAAVKNAIVTAAGVGLTYDEASSTYLKGATVAKQAAQVRNLWMETTDPQLTVDVSLDGVVTVKAGGELVTNATVTVNGDALKYYTRAYAAGPGGAPYVKASIYNYEGQVTEMSVYTTDYLSGPENLAANMAFNGNHLTFCNPGYALGGVPMGQLTDYENALNAPIAPATTVAFSGTVAGISVSASAVMPTAPVITGATSWYQQGLVWNSAAANTITWSGASPLGSASTFKLVVKTPMSLGGLFLGPIFNPIEYPALTNTVIPSSATSFTIPAGTLPPGIYTLYLGLQTTDSGRTLITNGDASGGVQFQVYGKPLVVNVQ